MNDRLNVIKTRFVIAVPDLKLSSAFYRDVLQFEVGELAPGWMIYQAGNCIIMAGECRDAMPPAQLGDHSYFAYLEISGIDSFFAAVTSAGAKIGKPLRDEPWGMREFGVMTADGHRIMFGEPTGDTQTKRE
jgi:uncharacterized glyoxalase superfamily protein PhnB